MLNNLLPISVTLKSLQIERFKNYVNGALTGYTGSCVNVTYSGGLAITCND